MNDILKKLNDEQLESVITTDVPVRVIAGAGSGKTRVITTKIAYLIDKLNIQPFKILAVTFTNKAATEMKNRVQSILPNLKYSPFITTFHSMCSRILREEYQHLGLNNKFQIIDTSDQKAIVKKIMKELNIENERGKSEMKVLKAIEKWKNSFTDPTEADELAKPGQETNFARVYRAYKKICDDQSLVDFNDLLLMVHKLFNTNIDIRNKWISRYDYILVDEFQDTNYIQFDLIKWLHSKRNCLTVVGDPDQTIYSWRGAVMDIIMNFNESYPNARTVMLNKNYRSTKQILDLANGFIDNNKNRIKKDIVTTKDGGQKVFLKETASRNFEAKYVAQKIKELVAEKKYDYKDFFILYRINAWSQEFEKEFANAKIPFQLVGGFAFRDRKVIKDVTALLKVLVMHDDLSMERIFSFTPKVGAVAIQKLTQIARDLNVSLFELITRHPEEAATVTRYLDELTNVMLTAESMYRDNCDIMTIAKYLVDKSGYKSRLDLKDNEDRDSLQNLEAYYDQMTKFDQTFDPVEVGLENKLDAFLQDMQLDKMEQTEMVQNKVTLLTIHAAKGLENKVVFVVGVNKSVFPSNFGIPSINQIEEERRAFYVAMTRAEEVLYISYVDGEYSYISNENLSASRFIEELDGSLLEFEQNIYFHSPTEMSSKQYSSFTASKPAPTKVETKVKAGDTISHTIYGRGKVVKVLDKFFNVAFENPAYKVKAIPINSAAWETE